MEMQAYKCSEDVTVDALKSAICTVMGIDPSTVRSLKVHIEGGVSKITISQWVSFTQLTTHEVTIEDPTIVRRPEIDELLGLLADWRQYQ